MRVRAIAGVAAAAVVVGCTPEVGRDGYPEAMEFEPSGGRIPEPTGLIVNPETGRIDFALAGAPLPEDCATVRAEAECLFNRYLEELDGFPTVTTATAPVTASLDASTLVPRDNVVVLAGDELREWTDYSVGFDAARRRLMVTPQPSWRIGETVWVAVRGYGAGVRAVSGRDVVGSPTLALLKQDSSLTCDAESPGALDAECPAFALLTQNEPEESARMTLFTLESIRAAYDASGVWTRLAELGFPKEEVAALWSFPVHSAAVAEIEPSRGLVPRVTAANEIRIALQGALDSDTVSAFVVREQLGSVVVMDLTAASEGDLVGGFPRVEASYADGEVIVTGAADFVIAHQYGVFITSDVRDASGAPLVRTPISVLLTSTAPLVTESDESALSTLSGAEARALEEGRAQLAQLFDDPVFSALTGVRRESLVYCFAFPFGPESTP